MNQELEQAVVKYGNDTWKDGYGQGVYEEQERIIKLIAEWDFPVNQGTYTVFDSVKSLIALIKGEK